MKLIRYPQYKPFAQPSVVTIGNFDGVHLGHQTLIKDVNGYARENGLASVVVTMQPLASQYFKGKQSVNILTTLKQKYHLIKVIGIDLLCVLNFNKRLSQLSAEDFITDVLIDGLNARHIFIGDDFKFGKGRVGDFDLLSNFCKPLNIPVRSMKTINDIGGQRVSSSVIRKLLLDGRCEQAKDLLGRWFSILGKVTRGQQLGRELGYPTINVRLKNREVPVEGIFCVSVIFNGECERTYCGSASIGTRPTVNGIEKILEVYILDFNEDVYGENVEVLFHHKIRNEVKFDGLNELKRHIENDVIKTRLYFKDKKM